MTKVVELAAIRLCLSGLSRGGTKRQVAAKRTKQPVTSGLPVKKNSVQLDGSKS